MSPITPDEAEIEVVGGVDTHQDTHTAAAIDLVGRVLGTKQFPATASGYAALLAWMHGHGRLSRVGVEGTGAYGAGLVRLLRDEQMQVIEVDRPDRKTRRFQGKSDPIDAIQAARTALAGERTGTPKQRDGRVEALRNLRVARRSAVDQRAETQRQMKALIVTAPDELRAQLRGLNITKLIATCANLQPDQADAAIPAVAVALRSLARRHQHLSTEIANLGELLEPLVADHQPGPAGRERRRTRRRRAAVGQRWREPRPARHRSRVRHALRGRSDPGQLRQDHPAPAQPRRRQTGQRRALPRRTRPTAMGPTHP